MKKILTYLVGSLSIAALLSSCAKEIQTNEAETVVRTVTFQAGVDKTKTQMNSDLKSFTWENTEFSQVHIWENSTKGTIDAENSDFDMDGTYTTAMFTAEFTGEEPKNPVYYSIVGPASVYAATLVNLPSEQMAGANSYDSAADILVAQPIEVTSRDSAPLFKYAHAIAINKLTLKGMTAGETLKSVGITADQPLAGNINVNYASGVSLSYQEAGSKNITITLPESTTTVAEGNAVYFTSFPASVKQLTVTAVTEDTSGNFKFYKKVVGDGSEEKVKFDLSRTANITLTFTAAAETMEYAGEWLITNGSDKAAKYFETNNTNLKCEDIVISGDKVMFESSEAIADATFTVGIIEGGEYVGKYYIKDAAGKYIYSGTSGGNLKGLNTLGSTGDYAWDIECTDDVWTVKNNITGDGELKNSIRYNSNSTLFNTYPAGNQTAIVLYEASVAKVNDIPVITASNKTLENGDAATGISLEASFARTTSVEVAAYNEEGCSSNCSWISNLSAASSEPFAITFDVAAGSNEERTAYIKITAHNSSTSPATEAYYVVSVTQPAAGSLAAVDVLTYAFTGLTGNNNVTYTGWSGKSYSGGSSAVYAGNSAAKEGLDYIQLRNTSPSGIVSTTSGGVVKKIVVSWNSSTTTKNRGIDIFAKNTAYSGPSDLYSDETKGENIGRLRCTADDSTTSINDTELTINGSYAYVGIYAYGGATYINSISITWDKTVSTPVISCNYDEVTISCSTAGATIYYTTDGTTPTTSSNVYSDSFKISAAATVKAYAVLTGFNDSEVATEDCTPVCAPVTASVDAGNVSAGTSVELSCATEGATIYYTVDNSEPTTSSSVYSEALTINATTTVKAIAAKENYTSCEVQTFTYTVVVATPLDAPTGLSFASNTLTWTAVDNASSYNVKVGDNEPVSATTASFNMSTYAAGTYSVTVQALSTDAAYSASEWSDACECIVSSKLTISIDFTSTSQRPSNFPTSSSNKGTTLTAYTIEGYSFSFYAGTAYYWDGYLMLGKSGAYILFPAIEGKKLTQVEWTTTSGCSAKTTVALKSADGNSTIDNKSVTEAASTTYTWDLTSTTTNTQYRLQVTNANNTQLASLKLTYE